MEAEIRYAQLPGFRLPTSRTTERYILPVMSPAFVIFCYSSLSKLIQSLYRSPSLQANLTPE